MDEEEAVSDSHYGDEPKTATLHHNGRSPGRNLKHQDTVEEVKIVIKKQKKIPNYMKPNAAWLGRNNTDEQHE